MCPELYDCWKMCVISGAIWSATSFRTQAGSSSGPVALLAIFSDTVFSKHNVGHRWEGKMSLFGGREFSLVKMD